MNKKILIIAIIIFQVLVIYYILSNFQHKQIVSTFISRNDLQNLPTSNHKFFYEPKANTIIEDHIDWLSTVPKHTINADSLNERYNYSPEKKDGVFRIMAVGDSFTYGQYVNTKDNWTELLEEYLRTHNVCNKIQKYEVINLGVSGYDLAYETERYIRRGKKYNPDIIIMLVVEFGRVTEHRIANQGKVVMSVAQKREYRKKGEYYPETSIIDSELSTDLRTQYQKKYFEIFKSQYNKEVLLVDFEQNPIYQPVIAQIIKANDNISLLKTKLSWDDHKYFFPDGHLNEIGHKKMMEEILNGLKKNKLLPCN